MSKLKSPGEKKSKSYQADCRNTYGENAKASRKNIPRSKQRGHMAERRVVADALRGLNRQLLAMDMDKVDDDVKVKSRLKRLSRFKKFPDIPLGTYLKRRTARKVPNK